MTEQKLIAKAEEQIEKQERKLNAEEAKQEERIKVSKRTAKRKLSKAVNECNSVCHICKRKIIREFELRCDDCQILCNGLCAQKCHKRHSPVSNDDVTSIFRNCYKEENFLYI
jgi:hypothetical protein